MKKIEELKKDWFLTQLQKLIKKNIKKVDIARDLNIKPQYLNSVLQGARGLTDQFLDKFIQTYNINQFDLQNKEQFKHYVTEKEAIKLFIDKIEAQAREIETLKQEITQLHKNLPDGNLPHGPA